jgi:hypothetical protein
MTKKIFTIDRFALCTTKWMMEHDVDNNWNNLKDYSKWLTCIMIQGWQSTYRIQNYFYKGLNFYYIFGTMLS